MSDKNSTGFDLDSFNVDAAEEGVFMQLSNPTTAEPLVDESTNEPVGIKLLGKDSKVYHKAQHAISNKRFTKARKGGVGVTSEQIEAEAIEVMAKCTVSWHGIKVKGEVIECTENSAKKLYKDFPWIKEQVDDFINERANFLS